jgi:transposase
VPEGSAIAKAIDHSLNHWVGLGRFLLDGAVPIDNNCVENRIRPWALGLRNWLFNGFQLAGERAAVVMSCCNRPSSTGTIPGLT